MRSYFDINIKGKKVWRACALVGLGLFLTCCLVQIRSVDAPTTANAGDHFTIVTTDTLNVTADRTCNFIIGILVPKGWDGAHNITNVKYVSAKGNGPMQLISPTEIEPLSKSLGTNLSYPASMKSKFKIGGNVTDDLEWVVFEGTQQVSVANGDNIGGTISFDITVGIDGNTTVYKPAYVICESTDGLQNYDAADPYWGYFNGQVMTVNGPGDLIDLYNPQLISFDPAKTLDDEFLTLTYNEKLDTAHKVQGPNYYLCVDTLITSDNKVTTNICSQAIKAKFTPTGNGLYRLTLWPHTYFDLPNGVSATEMIFHVADANGKKVGFADTDAGFIRKFKCN